MTLPDYPAQTIPVPIIQTTYLSLALGMRVAIAFAIPLLAAFIAAGAIAIYGFSYFEHAWGRLNSLQVYAWIAVLLACIAGLSAWMATRLTPLQVTPSTRSLWQAGVVFAVSATALMWALGPLGYGLTVPVLICLIGAFVVSALWLRRPHAHEAES